MPEYIIAKLALLSFPQLFMERLFFFQTLHNNALTHQKICEFDCGATIQ